MQEIIIWSDKAYSDVSLSVYNSLLETHNLFDIWRNMHPDKKQYTYGEISRLGNFLVSEAFTNYVPNSDILRACIYSNHKCFKIDINLSSSKRGHGR